jgi:glycosyltransferase involved in cell wall biosynthesis
VRIAIDVRRILDFGIGTYISNLLRAFQELKPPHEFVLIGAPDQRRYFQSLVPGFCFVPHNISDLKRKDHLALPRLVRNLDVDLTHIPFTRVPLFLPKPYVITVHDLSSVMFDTSSPWLRQLRRMRFHRSVERADRVIAVSLATLRDLENLTGIEHNRAHVIYNAPDPVFFQPARSADARAAGPDSRQVEHRRILERYQIDYPFLLYAGHIRRQKNIPRMVEAFAVARQQLADDPVYKELRLIIIGDDIHQHPEVRRAVIQSRVEHRVRFLGFVPFGTLRLFYELAAAFLFPSLYEGFGLPPLEAMASGTPVITSAVSSLLEVVQDGAALVNPENVFDISRGICEVLCNPELRAALITRGRARAEAFSWMTAARQTVETYEEAASNARKQTISE